MPKVMRLVHYAGFSRVGSHRWTHLQDVDRGAATGGGGGPGDAGGAGGVRVQAKCPAGPVQAGLRQLPHLRQARRLLRGRHVLGPCAQGGLAQLTCQAPLSLLRNHCCFPQLNLS